MPYWIMFLRVVMSRIVQKGLNFALDSELICWLESYMKVPKLITKGEALQNSLPGRHSQMILQCNVENLYFSESS